MKNTNEHGGVTANEITIQTSAFSSRCGKGCLRFVRRSRHQNVALKTETDNCFAQQNRMCNFQELPYNLCMGLEV